MYEEYDDKKKNGTRTMNIAKNEYFFSYNTETFV